MWYHSWGQVSDTDGFFLEMSYINPKHLTEPELQMMIDDRATD